MGCVAETIAEIRLCGDTEGMFYKLTLPLGLVWLWPGLRRDSEWEYGLEGTLFPLLPRSVEAPSLVNFIRYLI